MNVNIPIELILAVAATVPYWPLLVVCNVPTYDDDPIIRQTMDKWKRTKSWTQWFFKPWKKQSDRLIPNMLTILNIRFKFERGWLFVNIVIHALVSITAYHVFLYALDPMFAFIAALAFAWHPDGVMAVTQTILGRPSMLCALFAISGVLLFLSAMPWLAVFPATLSVYTKQESWAMPGLLLLVSLAV